eukprot:15675-Pleurochrysis_carterae.AAC.1
MAAPILAAYTSACHRTGTEAEGMNKCVVHFTWQLLSSPSGCAHQNPLAISFCVYISICLLPCKVSVSVSGTCPPVPEFVLVPVPMHVTVPVPVPVPKSTHKLRHAGRLDLYAYGMDKKQNGNWQRP